MSRLFVIEEVPAWRPHIASRAKARRSPKIQLADPSLAAAALEVEVNGLLRNLSYSGRLFESMVMRDLLVYAQANRCSVSYYRDSDNVEVDLIVEHPDGRWMAAEVKLGGAAAIDKGARALRRLCDKLDHAKTGPPARLMVITASGYAYERPDGVGVAPIASLGP